MAKKKLPSPSDMLDEFRAVLNRGEFGRNFGRLNSTLIFEHGKTSNKNKLLIIPEDDLMNLIQGDENEDKCVITELNPTSPEDVENIKLVEYGNDIENHWIALTKNHHVVIKDTFYTGEIFEIKIDGFDYKVQINKELLPLKLRKSEYCHITYRVFKLDKHQHILAIKKYFPAKIDNHGFTIIRLFKIV